jgi:hypothetical protein
MARPATFDKPFVACNMFHMKQRPPELMDVILAVGGLSELSRRLGLTRQAVSHWNKVPFKYLRTISEMTGIPREKLRPDLYG